MLATAGPVPGGDRWAFEIKFDGIRAVAAARDGRLRLRSRNDKDLTAGYPELSELDLGPGLLLDTEVVALDSSGRADFGLLQQRMNLTRPSAELREQVPVTLVVFDLLHHDGEDLVRVPYERRREALLELGLDEHGGVYVPPSFTGISGEQMLSAVDAQGLEGVVAKRLDSRYEPGRRSRSWIKTPIRRTCSVAVIGWTPSATSGRHLSSLQMAVPDGSGELVYAGDVGTGFSQATRDRLRDLLEERSRPDPPVPVDDRTHRWRPAGPLGTVHWAEPGLVGDIHYRQFTRDGSFRHPSWHGLRPDVDLSDLEPPT
ncbi:bifunctional non-homologous end joining protein LigD [Pseudonocardia endophytica]|uniref:DNA ligase (ATP) n=2 Tax=Pseudonocardia endophytica TaxID=401976 RepID=A0A4R1HVV2_PSEEN|nr:bifunctional non-homologous end joining protein LigD [Pseudonocardia endophytica]